MEKQISIKKACNNVVVWLRQCFQAKGCLFACLLGNSFYMIMPKGLEFLVYDGHPVVVIRKSGEDWSKTLPYAIFSLKFPFYPFFFFFLTFIFLLLFPPFCLSSFISSFLSFFFYFLLFVFFF